MSIEKETRMESYIRRPVTRQAAILEELGSRELTARQLARLMGYDDLNAIKPRLTELKKAGKVEVVRKSLDHVTNRNVAVWAAVKGE